MELLQEFNCTFCDQLKYTLKPVGGDRYGYGESKKLVGHFCRPPPRPTQVFSKNVPNSMKHITVQKYSIPSKKFCDFEKKIPKFLSTETRNMECGNCCLLHWSRCPGFGKCTEDGVICSQMHTSVNPPVFATSQHGYILKACTGLV